MEFDISRLRRGELIAAVGGALLFILLFFHWYSVDVKVSAGAFSRSGTFGSASAWQAFSFIDIYLFLVVLLAIGLAVLAATQRTPALPVTASVITTAAAGLGTLFVLYRLIDTPGKGGSESFAGGSASVDVSPTIWAFLGLVVTAGITYAGYMSMREEGTSFADAREQARAAGQQARSAFEGSGSGGGSAPPPPAAEPPAAAAPPPPPSPEPPAPIEPPAPPPVEESPPYEPEPPAASEPPEDDAPLAPQASPINPAPSQPPPAS